MKPDTSDFYPDSPGSDCDPDLEREFPAASAGAHSSSVENDPEAADHEPSPEREPASPELEPTPRHPATDSWIARCCNVLSWVLVPLMLPVYATMVILTVSLMNLLPFNVKLGLTLIAFILNFIMPMLIVLLLKRFGVVDDLGLNGRRERLVPYIVTILALGVTALIFRHQGAPEWMWMFFTGGATGALINMLVNFGWKISAHAAGIAGLVALETWLASSDIPHVDLTWWLTATIMLAGLLGSARIWLGRHTPEQVMAGYAVGFLAVYIPVCLI